MEKDEQPSFVKIFHGGLAKELKIPDPFMDQHSQILPDKLALILRNGNPVVVSVERRSKGQCFFTLGWTHFVEENNLEDDDIVFFYFHGVRTVKIVVYDLLGCLKGVKLTYQGSAEPINVGTRRYNRADSKEREKWFEVIIKPHSRRQMRIPAVFSDSAGLKVGGNAVLEDPNGKVWSIVVGATGVKCRQNQLSIGWSEFIRENEVEDGDKLSFFLKSNLIQVKIQKEGVVVID